MTRQMTSRRWAAVFAATAAVLALLSWWLWRPAAAQTATIWQDGVCIAQLPLSEDTELTIESLDGGYNRIVIRDGALSVVEADCPDGVCVARGAVRGGLPVVCLPHRLVITFSADAAVDGVVG